MECDVGYESCRVLKSIVSIPHPTFHVELDYGPDVTREEEEGCMISFGLEMVKMPYNHLQIVKKTWWMLRLGFGIKMEVLESSGQIHVVMKRILNTSIGLWNTQFWLAGSIQRARADSSSKIGRETIFGCDKPAEWEVIDRSSPKDLVWTVPALFVLFCASKMVATGLGMTCWRQTMSNG